MFDAIHPPRAVDEIVGQLRGMVAAGALRPGDRLPAERDLATRLQVSRNTLREALRTLENAGLVEMRKGAAGGAFVREASSGAIVSGMQDLYHLGAITPQQLTEARLWFSDIVVRVACERATEDDFARLEANVRAMEAAHAAGDFDERQRLNRAFHVILARAVRNPIVETTMEGVMEVFGHFIRTIGPSDNAFLIPSRRRFLKRLRARDVEGATDEMRKLLERLQTRYLALWSERAAQPVVVPAREPRTAGRRRAGG